MTILLLILLLLISFSLSAIEAALLMVSRVRVRHQASLGDSTARKLLSLLEQKERTMVAILILNHLTNLSAFIIIAQLLVEKVPNHPYLFAFLAALPVYLLFLEVIPKAIGRLTPYRFLSKTLPIAIAVDATFGPLVQIGSFFGKWFERVESESNEGDQWMREEFRTLTADVSAAGALGKIEKEMIHRLIDSQDLTAGEAMTPLSKVTAVPLQMKATELLQLASKRNLLYVPVLGNTGRLVGTADVFELLLSNLKPKGTLFDYLRKLPSFSESDSVSDILYRLRRGGHELAAVEDENGEHVGILSADSLTEFLFARDHHRAPTRNLV